MNAKFWGMLGLARKAGKVETGESRTLDAVKGEKAKLVILSEDASQNTSKRILDKCSFRNIKVLMVQSRQELGCALGKKDVVTAVVIDGNFAERLSELADGKY